MGDICSPVFCCEAAALSDVRRMLFKCMISCCFGSRLGDSSPVDCHLVDPGGPCSVAGHH